MPLGLEYRNGERNGLYSESAFVQQAIARIQMTPEERAAYDSMIAQMKLADMATQARINAFKSFKPETLTKDKTTKLIEYIREKSLAGDWVEFFRMIPAREFGSTLPVTKFRFNWGPDGKPIYVPMTLVDWQNYFGDPQRGRWITNTPFLYVCNGGWAEGHAKDKFAMSQTAAKRYPNTDPRHAFIFTPSQFRCIEHGGSWWVQLRKPILITAAIVTAAVFLGPAIGGTATTSATTTGGALATSGGIVAPTAAVTGTAATSTTTLFSSIKAGTKTLLSYVNKARTINAIVHGELPPPPIGISGASFTEWATIVAKDLAIKEAKELAAEKGIEYIQRKMTEREEAKLRAEIIGIQAEIDRLMVKDIPITPSNELLPEVREKINQMQAIEKDREQTTLITLGLLGTGAFLLAG